MYSACYAAITTWYIHRMYFKVKPDSSLAWSLIEQSTDTTGEPQSVFSFLVRSYEGGKEFDQNAFL